MRYRPHRSNAIEIEHGGGKEERSVAERGERGSTLPRLSQSALCATPCEDGSSHLANGGSGVVIGCLLFPSWLFPLLMQDGRGDRKLVLCKMPCLAKRPGWKEGGRDESKLPSGPKVVFRHFESFELFGRRRRRRGRDANVHFAQKCAGEAPYLTSGGPKKTH